eukprot:4498750-Pyramimonas_sp.AAC.2
MLVTMIGPGGADGNGSGGYMPSGHHPHYYMPPESMGLPAAYMVRPSTPRFVFARSGPPPPVCATPE